MDMFVNKGDAVIFTFGEIDLISDAIEKLIFKEFFERKDTTLTIRCATLDETRFDRVIYCRNKVDVDVEKVSKSVESNTFQEFVESAGSYPVPYFDIMHGSMGGAGVSVYAMGMKIDSGYIFSACSANEEGCQKEMVACLYGLNLVLCDIMAERDKSAKDFSASLRATKIESLDKITRNAINKRVDQFLRQ